MYKESYFTFPQEALLRTGRRIRICQKQGPKEVGVEYILGAKTPLTSKITWIRLLDSTGKIVIHDQIIEPKSNYSNPIVLDLSENSSSDAILLPNSDSTCALILLKDQAGEVSIPEGDYTIRFEFRRNIGSEAPILREAGDKSSESVILRFLLT